MFAMEMPVAYQQSYRVTAS